METFTFSEFDVHDIFLGGINNFVMHTLYCFKTIKVTRKANSNINNNLNDSFITTLKQETITNKEHLENADTSTSVTFDLEL